MLINSVTWRDIYTLAFPVFGLAVLAFGIWWTRPSKTNKANVTNRDTIITNETTLDTETVESLIFRWIFRLDAVQLRQGKNYVSLNYRLASALPYDLKLMKGKALLIVDNDSTEEWVLDPMILQKQSSVPLYKEITLGEKISASTRERLRSKVAVRIRLSITYWDYQGKEYHFDTDVNGLEIIALA